MSTFFVPPVSYTTSTWSYPRGPKDPHGDRWILGMREQVERAFHEYKFGHRQHTPRLTSRDGQILTTEEWYELIQLEFYRRLAFFQYEETLVSLVWSGWNYERHSAKVPEMYELAISSLSNNGLDGFCSRFTDEAEAWAAYNRVLSTGLALPTEQEITRVVKSLKEML